MELPPNPTEWYMQLLAPLSPDIKLDLICKLAESLKEKLPHSEKVTSKSEDFFETLSGAWEEDITNDKSGIEKAMEDVKAGRVDKAKDADELFKQIVLLELGQVTPEKAFEDFKIQVELNVDEDEVVFELN